MLYSPNSASTSSSSTWDMMSVRSTSKKYNPKPSPSFEPSTFNRSTSVVIQAFLCALKSFWNKLPSLIIPERVAVSWSTEIFLYWLSSITFQISLFCSILTWLESKKVAEKLACWRLSENAKNCFTFDVSGSDWILSFLFKDSLPVFFLVSVPSSIASYKIWASSAVPSSFPTFKLLTTPALALWPQQGHWFILLNAVSSPSLFDWRTLNIECWKLSPQLHRRAFKFPATWIAPHFEQTLYSSRISRSTSSSFNSLLNKK